MEAEPPHLLGRRNLPPGKRENKRTRNTRTERCLGGVVSVSCPVATFHSGGVQTNGGETIGRRRLVSKVSRVFAPRKSTSRMEKTNVGPEAERRGISASAFLHLPPAELTERAEQDQRWRSSLTESPLLRSRHGQFSSRIDRTGTKSTIGRGDFARSAVLAKPPWLFLRRHCALERRKYLRWRRISSRRQI